MDRPSAARQHSTGIPRLVSRLPLPTNTPSRSVRPSPSRERLQADPGLNISRLRRPSQEVFKKPYPRPASPSKPTGIPYGHNRESTRSWSTSDRSTVSAGAPESEINGSETSSDIVSTGAPSPGLQTPSLSDRTIETLSKIPPSPSPSRKTSPFFPMETPLSPPAHSASVRAPRSSRPPSRQESGYAPALPGVPSSQSSAGIRSPSAPAVPRTLNKRASNLFRDSPTKHAVANSNRTPRRNDAYGEADDISPLKPDHSTPVTPRTSFYGGSKSLSVRTKTVRKSVSQVFTENTSHNNQSQTPSGLSVSKTRKITTPKAPCTSDTSLSDSTTQQRESRNASKSSSALRETIAKAKAAKRAARESNSKNGFSDPFDAIDTRDPFGQGGSTEVSKGVLRSRTKTARTSGHLNIAALGLKEIPNEVLTMYDFDPNSNEEWYGSVDLVKFIAADNEFESLPDDAFPDISMEDLEMEENPNAGQFGGLEILDLHGNMLTSLPLGLRKLHQLHSLNLSNNRLTMDSLEVITQIEHLTDLKLANNNLEGGLTAGIGSLNRLEILDLRNNALTKLPDTLSSLVSLRLLNVAENQLSSLPSDAFRSLRLVELNAQKNRLKGHLFPTSINRLETLQVLDIANNSLEALSATDDLSLPNLQQLLIDGNRMKKLPNVYSWQSLISLTAANNDISEIPEGLSELTRVKVIDFTANSLTKLDVRIGLMDSLTSFRIANNPLREPRFLSLDTEELKRDLRNRCEPEVQANEETDGSVQTEFTLAPESPSASHAWRIKSGGVLDLSSADFDDLDPSELETALSSSSYEMRCLYLHHNRFLRIPVSGLSLIAHSLTDLDLSHNPLDSSDLITTSLSLPHLQNLTLSSTGLKSLEPLQAYLSAPALTFLDVSNNRLSGPLPFVRYSYPNLITFLASDNQIDSLEFDAVQGLQVLDVSNNNVDALPPRLGLLGGESSSNRGPGLRRFEVAGNSFRVPRWQVVAKGTEAILEWLKNRITDEELKEWSVDAREEST
ncbi:hypothetical protein AJ80_07129 [Polytolypa hystricis UAMH7299]|uniref:Leucine-rich repeat-containing protein 40 n=1 Tax=Polytolypa hystricis (strain UAMH7299) TaxID=1447883 RepID=A0A2B7XR77_POLH7|nr:hypothetical protein AJ80_07129 [Polytolypa hystricis UAMH7299]